MNGAGKAKQKRQITAGIKFNEPEARLLAESYLCGSSINFSKFDLTFYLTFYHI